MLGNVLTTTFNKTSIMGFVIVPTAICPIILVAIVGRFVLFTLEEKNLNKKYDMNFVYV